MELDALLLSRIQFALTIAFHYLFPPLTIGLGWMMVSMEWKYLRTGARHGLPGADPAGLVPALARPVV